MRLKTQGSEQFTMPHLVALSALTLTAFAIPVSVSATTLLYLLTCLLTLLFLVCRNQFNSILRNPAALTFWALFAVFLLGLTYTSSPWPQAIKDLQKRHWMLLTPILMLLISTDVWRNRIINAFLLSMVLTLVLSFLKWFDLDPVSVIYALKTDKINVFFEQIVQTFFMSIAAFIFAHRAIYNKQLRWFNATLFFLFAFNVLFMSDGRTGYGVLILLLLYLSWIRWHWKGTFLCLVGIMALLFITFSLSPTFQNRVKSIPLQVQNYQKNNEFNSLSQRIGMWQNTIILIKKHPWLGYGTGGIRHPMEENLNQSQIARSGWVDYVENTFLNFWLQFGVLGLVVILAVIVIQVKATFYLKNPYKPIMQGFLLAFIVGSFFNSFFTSFCEAHLYSLFAAVCFSAYENNN